MRKVLPFLLGSLFLVQAHAQDAPPIYLSSIDLMDLDGKAVSLDEFEGKAILINFWATWCKPCVYEIPAIESAQEKMQGKDIVFLMVSDENPSKIRKFVQKNNYQLRFLRMRTSFKEANVKYVPTTLLVNKDRQIVRQHVGYKDWSLRPQIKELTKLTE